LHSPVVPAGVALSAMKRDVEQERENKKKGIAMGPGPGADDGKEGKEKTPKVKRMVVRGKR
jgi:signal recognition particle subunit SRP19